MPARTLSRRVVLLGGLSAAGLVTASGCTRDTSAGDASSQDAGTGAATQAASRPVKTALGRISVVGDTGRQWDAELVAAASLVRQVWTPKGALRVTFCADDAEFLSVATGLDADTAAVTAPDGIYVSPTAARALTAQGRTQVLAHELTHAVLHHVGNDTTPLWLREGLAEWTAQRTLTMKRAQLWPGLAEKDRGGALPSGPPAAETFSADPALGYQTSAAYIAYVAHVAGMNGVKRLSQARTSDATARAVAASLTAGAEPFPHWLHAELSR